MPDTDTQFGEALERALSLLPQDCPNRLELAGVAAHALTTGRNITRMAKAMNRSRWWVYRQLNMLQDVFAPLHGEYTDYLGE
jgi:hypothetical protein